MIFKDERLRWVSVFVLSYIIGGIVLAYEKLNYEFMYYGMTVMLEIALIVYIDRHVKFQKWIMWCLAIWGLVHFAGGLMPIPAEYTEAGRPANLYNLRVSPYLPRFDQIVHTFGFGIATLFCYEAMHHRYKDFRKDSATFGILFLCGCGLGAMNEVIEFIAVVLMPETNVGGYENTGWDLVCNALGTLIALTIVWNKKDNAKPLPSEV